MDLDVQAESGVGRHHPLCGFFLVIMFQTKQTAPTGLDKELRKKHAMRNLPEGVREVVHLDSAAKGDLAFINRGSLQNHFYRTGSEAIKSSNT